MITFEALREVAQAEKKDQKPAKLPDLFFGEIQNYLAQKLPPMERESAKIQLDELLDLRDKKILNLAFFYVRSGVQPANLTTEEKRLFDRLVGVIKNYHQERKELLEGPSETMVVIAFLQDVPAFVGLNVRTYGPFKAGDIATLPENEANVIVQKGAGRRIEIENKPAPP